MEKIKNILLKHIPELISVIILLSGVTFAAYVWSSSDADKTEVLAGAGNITLGTVYYNEGMDISDASIKPTDTKEEGIVRTVTIRAKQEYKFKLTFDLYLDLLTLPDELKDASFKYEVYRNDEETPINSGSFSTDDPNLEECTYNSTDDNNINHIVLVKDNLVTTTKTSYTIYIWIDKSMDSPASMAGKTFSFKLHASGKNANMLGEPNILVDVINNLYNDANKTEVLHDGENITYNYASQVSLMNDRLGSSSVGIDDGNIRYYGATPNNYIDIGDKYETDTKAWIVPLSTYGISDSMIPTTPAACKTFMQCSNLVAGRIFPNETVCEAQLPVLIYSFGYTSLDDMCSIKEAGTPILYRIIGLFKDVTLADGTKKDLVKIVRNLGVGSYSFDTSASDVNDGSGINEWSQSDLMKLLNPDFKRNYYYNSTDDTFYYVNNSLYWNGESGTCYNGTNNATTSCDFTGTGLSDSAKSKIEEVIWNTGGFSSVGLYPNQMYSSERGSTLVVPGTTCTDTTCNDTVTRNATWTGKVALMYPSDYGYAADFNKCSNVLSSYGSTGCYDNDWIFNASGTWSLTPNANNAIGTGDIYQSLTSFAVSNKLTVRPSFYLDPELTVYNTGNGTRDNPYVVIDTAVETTTINLKEHIKDLYADNASSTSANTGNGTYYYADSVQLMNDGLDITGTAITDKPSLLTATSGNLRYYGAEGDSLNNYIYFNCDTYPETNCEKWRIIGIVDGKVKIMRSTPIGTYSWDWTSTGEFDNNWSDATLMTLLNNGYYNSEDNVIHYNYINYSPTPITVNFGNPGEGEVKGITKETRTKGIIDIESVWYTNATLYESGEYPNAIYKEERTGTSTWPGAIALAYLSDYGYAADLRTCKKYLNVYYDSTCKSVNWMKNIITYNEYSAGWLITPSPYSIEELSSYDNHVWKVNGDGDASGSTYSDVYYGGSVTPVLYLNTDVAITSEGDGSNNNPYRISVS